MDDRPLTALFVDCDSFFASVEQHLDPSLRGHPVGVAPVLVDSSCCIAASYEAKRFGVKTGTGIREARQQCPGIRIVLAQPEQYIRFHHQIVAAVEDCIHVEAVLSIDEMWAWLPYNLREPATAEAIGRKIKETVARQVSPVIKVSIGLGPNKYLAKMASKMRKPDGLFTLPASDLPDVLHPLKLRDLTGINRRMEGRLVAAGIATVAELCAAPKPLLRGVWGGVLGDRLWHLLRGWEIPEIESSRKTIGHSHVLPPTLRKADGAWGVLCKLLHKACLRLRGHGLLAGGLMLHVAPERGPGWSGEMTFAETDSTLALHRSLGRLWDRRPEPGTRVLQVGVVLLRLVARDNFTPSLFDHAAPASVADKHRRLDAAIDRLVKRYGRGCVYFGAVTDREAAPMRISFTHIPDASERD